jgi:hypothetical protein
MRAFSCVILLEVANKALHLCCARELCSSLFTGPFPTPRARGARGTPSVR